MVTVRWNHTLNGLTTGLSSTPTTCVIFGILVQGFLIAILQEEKQCASACWLAGASLDHYSMRVHHISVEGIWVIVVTPSSDFRFRRRISPSSSLFTCVSWCRWCLLPCSCNTLHRFQDWHRGGHPVHPVVRCRGAFLSNASYVAKILLSLIAPTAFSQSIYLIATAEAAKTVVTFAKMGQNLQDPTQGMTSSLPARAGVRTVLYMVLAL